MTKRSNKTTRTQPANRRITIRAAAARIPKVASATVPETKPAASRAGKSAERRAAIIEAAMDEFIARGFAATRLDDVAKRAGVAKGTLYLYFKDKESMFEELIRTALVPLIGRLTALPTITGPVRDAVERFAETFMREVVATRRGDIIRLIVSEGPRFPAIADFYFREVVSKGLTGMKALVQLAITRGEITHRELGDFPQLVVAPAIVAVIWQSLFDRHAPLDGLAMFKVHLDLIFGERRKT
ncbi:TetR/AcrR family transcriptional regulator [Bradyrhizobium sp. AUGA SZCCT0051]|nr:TetR/AcrR family transcriptional regulator [Bradyrhizobium sp. AUGA SZCCT0124]MBR1309833.1 TetR/AcrR family transcriptional regulator [Bradyrhizobium sp. AUGA SZCCT0051]MBR1339974.1 TetR/AcrR family transcriptional regulator [Bradyrhizobium sp. AUGA SZCCT0105]MBR1354581.1 TetR/AcrR family transcriptional regulator [Bradyrhizobium sp. AUGA SZCCT0045]